MPDDGLNDNEAKRVYLSGAQHAAIQAAFEEHKKWPDLPEELKTITKQRMVIDTTATTHQVWITPMERPGTIVIHPRYARGYLLDKKSLKLIKIIS